MPERYYFNKGEPRTHQIHMYEKGNTHVIEQLQFRDYLIVNKTARIQYEKLKIQLSQANLMININMQRIKQILLHRY